MAVICGSFGGKVNRGLTSVPFSSRAEAITIAMIGGALVSAARSVAGLVVSAGVGLAAFGGPLRVSEKAPGAASRLRKEETTTESAIAANAAVMTGTRLERLFLGIAASPDPPIHRGTGVSLL